jgi:4-amino-4-deoxy-L-arabinose transferase-like glycosyltransferase
MAGMTQKPRAQKTRIIRVAAWTFILLLGFLEIARSHGHPGFLPLLQIATALMVIVSEITGLLQEPSGESDSSVRD